MEYTIDNDKLQAVINLINDYHVSEYGFEVDPGDVENFILNDWQEGQEHQDWLDVASAQDIADWVTHPRILG